MVSQRKPNAVMVMVAVLCAFLFMPLLTVAQEQYPSRPINVISVGNAGGTGDLATRLLLGKAEKMLGQPLVITNNNMGGGTVPLTSFAKVKPDGYNLLATPSAPLLWMPHSQALSYKLSDFTPIMCHGLIGSSGLVVKADSPWKTFRDVVEYARKNPGKFTYAISGTGNPMDMAMQFVAKIEGVSWTAIPVPSSDPNMLVLGGHVNALSASPNWAQHVQNGSFRLLAVHSGSRLPEFPDAPTFKELGYDFIHESIAVQMLPKGAPDVVVKRLDDAFRKAMEDKEYRDLLKKINWQYKYLGPEDLKKYLEQSYVSVGDVVKKIRN
jgi:tripartite-type tricarboxylate transporter receptor subunit TctC